MEHLVDVQCRKGLDLSVHTCLRIKFLRDTNILLILFKECFEIKLAVTLIASYRRTLDRMRFILLMLERRIVVP